jgi:hypothetical protein
MILPNPKTRVCDVPWSLSGDRLWLLTLDELSNIPEGTVLTSILGNTATVGVDVIDEDTRGGCVAWGLLESQLAEGTK